MRRLYFGVLIMLLGCFMALGDTYQHKEGGISIWFPDNWKITTNEGLLEATAPGQDAYAHLLVLQDIESLDDAVDTYSEELDTLVQDFKQSSEEGENIEINGLDIFFIEGEGKVEGAILEVGVALIASKKAITMMVTFNTKEAATKYSKDFEKILQSLKAI